MTRTRTGPIPSARPFSPSRRRLLKALPLVALAPGVLAQTDTPPIAVQKLHSFGLRVSNPERSLDFYQDLFGAPVQSRQGDTVCLRIGDGPRFFSIAPVGAGEQPSISHIGLSVAGFDIDRVAAQLRARGLDRGSAPEPGQDRLDLAMRYWIVRRDQAVGGDRNGTRELYFADGEGIVYQLASADHCGGRGPLGEECGAPEPAPTAGRFELVDLSHFTNFMSNRGDANRFITGAFGKSYQAYQGPNAPVIGVGDGLQFLMYTGGNDGAAVTSPGSINHVCFSVTGFDVDRILEQLTDYGLTARQDPSATRPLMHWISMRMPNRGGAAGGTPELYFSDPDGLRIQLQDPGYCGGGGYLGDSCPPLA